MCLRVEGASYSLSPIRRLDDVTTVSHAPQGWNYTFTQSSDHHTGRNASYICVVGESLPLRMERISSLEGRFAKHNHFLVECGKIGELDDHNFATKEQAMEATSMHAAHA